MLAITLGAATLIWSFSVSTVAGLCGTDVSSRFLERGNRIPSKREWLTPDSLSQWLRDPDTGRYARQYAYYVIPLDFVFMTLLGAFTAMGSLAFAEWIAWPDPLEWWQQPLPFIAPVLYVLSDGAEDVFILLILLGPNLVRGALYTAMRFSTVTKVLFSSIALLQTFGLGLWTLLFSKI